MKVFAILTDVSGSDKRWLVPKWDDQRKCLLDRPEMFKTRKRAERMAKSLFTPGTWEIVEVDLLHYGLDYPTSAPLPESEYEGFTGPVSEDDLLEHMRKSGKPITRETLRSWVKQGLLPAPTVMCGVRKVKCAAPDECTPTFCKFHDAPVVH